uniref:Uncharacterized protein n=1 Tax=Photinus pyralis TaxID=7054 RepID=A0A1Y1JXV0_PHOPY
MCSLSKQDLKQRHQRVERARNCPREVEGDFSRRIDGPVRRYQLLQSRVLQRPATFARIHGVRERIDAQDRSSNREISFSYCGQDATRYGASRYQLSLASHWGGAISVPLAHHF